MSATLCYISRSLIKYLCDCPLLFQVINVDDDGNELGSGIMELTDTELILYTRKRDSVKWHYLCLRRYGYDSNLFSFESGRRCQTGQGRLIQPSFYPNIIIFEMCFQLFYILVQHLKKKFLIYKKVPKVNGLFRKYIVNLAIIYWAQFL